MSESIHMVLPGGSDFGGAVFCAAVKSLLGEAGEYIKVTYAQGPMELYGNPNKEIRADAIVGAKIDSLYVVSAITTAIRGVYPGAEVTVCITHQRKTLYLEGSTWRSYASPGKM